MEEYEEKKRKKFLLSDNKNDIYDYYRNRNWDYIDCNKGIFNFEKDFLLILQIENLMFKIILIILIIKIIMI